MFTRHLIAAAALVATSFSAQADVIAVSGSSSLAQGLSFADSVAPLSLLSAANSSAQFYLVRGVEGLYMVATRAVTPDTVVLGAPTVATDAPTASISAPVISAAVEVIPALVQADVSLDVLPTATADDVASDTPILIGTIAPTADADLPVVFATDVPEPSSVALLLAGMLGVAGFTRTRKQG